MILLGLNCGFGNADCGGLPTKALDLQAGWVTFARGKTGIEPPLSVVAGNRRRIAGGTRRQGQA